MRVIAGVVMGVAVFVGGYHVQAQTRAGGAAPRLVTITVSDPVDGKAAFSVGQIVAKPGEQIKVRLMSMAQTPKMILAHNWVLLKSGANVKAFVDAAANARATDYIPASMKTQILADIPMTGPGERFEVTFTAPKVPGKYPYICSFAGHYVGGMVGELIVK